MPVYRGIRQKPFRKSFAQILASGHYSENNDASVLTGEQTFSRLYERVVDKTISNLCDLRGDYLIYGWRPWNVPMVLLWMFSLGFLITGIILTVMRDTPSQIWLLTWPGGILVCAVLFYLSFWWYFRSPFSHYIVFDRRRRLIHLPRWLSHKQDSIRWDEADLCVLDIPTGYVGQDNSTELHVIPPPLTLKQSGTKPWWRFFKYHYDSKQRHMMYGDYTVDGAEAVFRFIIDFMTQPPEQSIALDVMPSSEMELEYEAKNDFKTFIHKERYFFSLIDPNRLPSEPNWVRDEQDRWQQVRPAVRARFGWFGLWNKSYTLPPHLRGTRADPNCKDDPEAPLPVSRWYAIEDGGTGQMFNQPPEVLASVLRGEGMPSEASLNKTRLKEGGWPGPNRSWWYEQFEQ
ncbi:MAG: hypothetical protein JXQ97_15790 [Natronospirillum sp.]